MKGKYLQFGLGLIVGGLLCGTTATAAANLTARPTTQTFYLSGERINLTAYLIGGSNYVRLRDLGRAVDFGVEYDAATNSVYIDPDAHYEQEVKPSAPATATPSALTEESVRAAIRALRDTYPSGTPYGAPYIPNNPLDRPFSNLDACAGWAMKCSDAAFGSLPYRRIMNPSWDEIRAGDLLDWRTNPSGHVVVVLEKTDEYIKVTESSTLNEALWGGQYFRWWLEEQPELRLHTRYPQ